LVRVSYLYFTSDEDDINNMRRLTGNVLVFDHFAFPDLDYYALEHELAVEVHLYLP